jgi:hypothetical protein
MMNLTLHNFRPDKFYPDFWVSPLGTVCTREEAERIVENKLITEQVRENRDKPFQRRKEMLKTGFEGLRRAA